MVEAISISDLHLGSHCCMAKQIEDFLDKIEERTKKLILNGDVFDDLNFKRLKKHHWKILSKLRKASDKIEIIWINGNHDGPAEVISQLLGIEFANEYVMESGSKKILFLHGDKFDDFITKKPIITWIADKVYNLLQKIDSKKIIAKWAKRNSKQYLRVKDKVKSKAIEYCLKKQCDAVCCGHTHYAEQEGHYYNSGCWTELPGTFLTINEGLVNLCKYEENNEIENIKDKNV